MMRACKRSWLTLATVCGLWLAGPSWAASTTNFTALAGITRTWTGFGNWDTPANWSPSGVPDATDTAVIELGSVVLSRATTNVSIVVEAGTTLTVSNWLSRLEATADVTIEGTVTLPPAFTDTGTSNRVAISCSNLFVASGGEINVDGKGFAGGPDAGHQAGYGPGAGLGGTGGGGGAGHGGRGGGGFQNWRISMAIAGGSYGSADGAANPGSGGGTGGNGLDYGGDGGGAVRIEATGSVVINGTITAQGSEGYVNPGSAHSAGCGAGGGISIVCHTIAGTGGVVQADGGNPGDWANFGYQTGGAGGGGRVSVQYNCTAQSNMPLPAISFSAAGGKRTNRKDLLWWGDLGTLYFSDGHFMGTAPSLYGEVVIPQFTHWSVSALTLDSTWLRIPADGLTLTVAGDLNVTGTDYFLHRFELSNATVNCGGDLLQTETTFTMSNGDPGSSSLSCSNMTLTGAYLTMPRSGNGGTAVSCSGDMTIDAGTLTQYGSLTNPAAMAVGGDLTLTNSGCAYVYSGMTNAAGPDYGSLVSVGGDALISAGSWIYPSAHSPNGGAVLFRVRDLVVSATNAGFNADGRGYSQGTAASSAGIGPGWGKGGKNSTGGGYGGVGGKLLTGYSQTYGLADAPILAGSSGGIGTSPTYDYGGTGGGVIRIEAAQTMTLRGTLTANGGNHTGRNDYGGAGGAGGSIYVRCRTLAGTNPVFSATGGIGCDNHNGAGGGGGGGGRIAIWRTWDNCLGLTTVVDGGVGYLPNVPAGCGDPTGAVGTVVWIDTGPVITNRPATGVTDVAAFMIGSLTSTGMAPTDVTCYWGQVDRGEDKGAWDTNTFMGTRGIETFTNDVTDLSPAAHYYYRFYATNAWGDAWSSPPADFSTLGGVAVNNHEGAGDIADSSATLRGDVTAGSPTPAAYICWGDNDAGASSTGDWDHVEYGGVVLGPYPVGVTGLTANKTYYYRCFVTNVDAGAWAPSTTNFTTTGPGLSAADVEITEGDGATNLTFVVLMSSTSELPVTVSCATADGTAIAGSDYVATNGLLTFAPGVISRTVRITVMGDTDDEYPSETLFLNLSDATNATIADAQALGTILDDDTGRQTKTWSGSGNWTNAANWTPARAPGPTDDVVIAPGSSCILSTPTVPLSSLVISNATLTFTNWNTALTATEVTVAQGGVITVPPAFTHVEMSNNVLIVCTDLSVEAGGSINVNGKGYAGGNTNHINGYGLGGGAGVSAGGGGGAGHGGPGGGGYQNWRLYPARAGVAYGSATHSVAPGSGGGANTKGYVGGHGGGAVRVNASGAVTVDGTITACGGQGTGKAGGSDSAGHGSGGSIWISCNTFGGAGTVLAAGGNPLKFGQAYSYMQGGGGSGGRIVVDYDPAAQLAAPAHNVCLSAAGGFNMEHVVLGWFGGLGTLCFTDTAILATPVVSHSGSLTVLGLTQWARTDLVLSNAWLRFPQDGFRLSLTNDLTVKGSAAGMNQLEVTNAVVSCRDLVQSVGTFAMYSGDPSGSALNCEDVTLSGGCTLSLPRGGNAGTTVSCGGDMTLDNATLTYYFPLTNPASFTVGGSMALTNAASAYVYSGVTNVAGAEDYGGLVDVAGDMVLASGCWVYPYSHSTSGGSVLFRANDMSILAANAGFNAVKKGYPQGTVPNSNGTGPGRGKGGWNSTGGGHGGLGGKALPGYGQTYGSSNAPVSAGSSGGLGSSTTADYGGVGGGVVRIEAAATLTVYGTLTADGGDHTGQNNYGGGGGAGGSVYVRCHELAGTSPVFSAQGGNGCDNRNTAGGGGGGGGRIAIWRTKDSSVGATANADGGVGYRPGVPSGCGDEAGAVGTIVWGDIPARGTMIILR